MNFFIKENRVKVTKKTKDSKKAAKKSPFSCLSCAGGGQAKFDEDEKPTTASPSKKTAAPAESTAAAVATTPAVTNESASSNKKQRTPKTKKPKQPKTSTESSQNKSATESQQQHRPKVTSKSPIRSELPKDAFVDVPTVITLDIQHSPMKNAKQPKAVVDSAKQQSQVTEVAVVVAAVAPVIEPQVISAPKYDENEKLFDASKFISLDTDESSGKELESQPQPTLQELVDKQLEQNEIEFQLENLARESSTPAVVELVSTTTTTTVTQEKPSESPQDDEGPMTPPTTPELKVKSAETKCVYIAIFVFCFTL